MGKLTIKELKRIVCGAKVNPGLVRELVGNHPNATIHHDKSGRFYFAVLDGIRVVSVYFPLSGPVIVLTF